MKWYEQRFVNRRDWVLENMERLGLNEKETVMVLLIDFMNEHHIEVTMEALHQKTGLGIEEVNQVISVLCAKKMLEIQASSSHISFVLNGLYDTDIAKSESVLDSSLFDAFESEFKRPLQPKEMEKISDWNKTSDRRMILYALREASVYQKLSLPYIESILNRWKSSGITVEMIEEGKGNGAH